MAHSKTKSVLAVALVAVMSITGFDAKAYNDEFSLYEATEFVKDLNEALNDTDVKDTREFLNMRVPNYANFRTNIAPVYNPHILSNWGSYVGKDGLLYRRHPLPQEAHYNRVGLWEMRKGDYIEHITAKKQTIPGFSTKLDIVGVTKITPSKYVLDVNVHEYGHAYHPYYYAAGYTHKGLLYASTCKVSLSEIMDKVYMTQMSCSHI